MRKKNIITVCIVCAALILLFVGAVAGDWAVIRNHAESNELDLMTSSMLFEDQIQLFDPQLVDYVEAAEHMQKREFNAAATGFEKLGDYYQAESLSDDCWYHYAEVLRTDMHHYKDAVELLEDLEADQYPGAGEAKEDTMLEWARYCADEREHFEALQILDRLEEEHGLDVDDQREDVLTDQVEYHLEQQDYFSALDAAEPYADSLDSMKDYVETISEEIYQEGKKNYVSLSMEKAKKYFRRIPDYSRSADYLQAIEYYTHPEKISADQQTVDEIARIADLPYVDSLLVRDLDIWAVYMQGTWKSDTGRYFFRVDSQGMWYSNLPRQTFGSIWWGIGNGALRYSTEPFSFSSEKMYEFMPTGPDTVDIYCEQDQNTYHFTRR